MTQFARPVQLRGMSCAELSAGGYFALIAPCMGSNVLRLRDTRHGIEFFRFDDGFFEAEPGARSVLYGFSTLYLPNRLDRGLLKTSDAVYRFPVNEPQLDNYIHGFLHQRSHTLARLSVQEDTALAETEYLYDENDPFFEHFPVKFRAEIRYRLSSRGLEQAYTLRNLSDRRLPVGLGSHTAIRAPFMENGSPENIRMTLPAGEELFLDERCLCTGESAETEQCALYRGGGLNPALPDINNRMFYAESIGDLHGVTLRDTQSGKAIAYKTGPEYGFWLVWNCGGGQGFFCPEPMTAMINAPNLPLPPEKTGYRELAPGESFTAHQHFFTV